MGESAHDPVAAAANRLYLRIQTLKEWQRKAAPLLQDTVDMHSDPESCGYNECEPENAPCAWCEEARALLSEPPE